jgi:hypothetical protein
MVCDLVEQNSVLELLVMSALHFLESLDMSLVAFLAIPNIVKPEVLASLYAVHNKINNLIMD